MIPEFGQFALIIALCFSVLLAVLPLVGAARDNTLWMDTARPLALGLCVFVGFSFLCLTYSFIVNDFSVLYVANNSSRQLPLWYRIPAVWGAHEGSMLLWVTILSVWTAAVAMFSRSLPLKTVARVLAVLGMVSFGFLLFTLATSNPFLRLLSNVPTNGRDLNALLQDPGFLFHPPTLYMGYVGLSVAFAFAIASLMSGRLEASWAKWTRPWTLAAWCFLTAGITLGSWWAYRELGWGGWWFWDPVENASFMPWLAATALLHSLAVTEKRQAFKAWTILLSIVAFSLSLLGTFLVRSGVLTSVHAFAVDPKRGLFMLVFLFIVVAASLTLYAWRANMIRKEAKFTLLSRETMLLTNNVLLFVAMSTVLLGTLYPLIIDAMHLGKLSVGAPYFNAVFIPIMTPVLFFMGMGPHCRWQSMSAQLVLTRLRYTFAVSISLAIILPWVLTGSITGHVILGLSLALWVIISSLQTLYQKRQQNTLTRAHYGMVFAHIGIAVCVIGIALSSAYTVERNIRLSPGASANLGPYQVQFNSIKNIDGSNYTGVAGLFTLLKNNKPISQLTPEKRFYTIQQTTMTDAAIDAGVFSDVYIALGQPVNNRAWSVRLYYKPFIRWIWAGGFLVLLGGLLALSDRRYRKRHAKKERRVRHAHQAV